MAKGKKKKSVAEIGETVPKNFKFALVISVAIFWAEFVRSLLKTLFNTILNNPMNVLVDLVMAITVTVLGYLILEGYRKILSLLKKLKIEG